MSEINEHINTEEKDVWEITDDQSAEWALKKIAEANEEAEKWREFYEHKIVDAATKSANTIEFFKAKLRQYFEKVPHHQTKTQESYELPSGKLVLKAQGPEYIRDDDVLICWAKVDHPELIKQTMVEKFDWSTMKKSIATDYVINSDGHAINTSTGEIVPGLTVNEREPKFTIE